MDYKDLANLIFPDAKPIEFYEEKYPEVWKNRAIRFNKISNSGWKGGERLFRNWKKVAFLVNFNISNSKKIIIQVNKG